jgi:CheY-like chemotaxis protein
MAQPCTQKRVLVIEDNYLTMALLGTILRSEGYEVLEAVTARGGLDAARRHRPELIVMDIRLPDMSGFDATQIVFWDRTDACKNGRLTPVGREIMVRRVVEGGIQ